MKSSVLLVSAVLKPSTDLGVSIAVICGMKTTAPTTRKQSSELRGVEHVSMTATRRLFGTAPFRFLERKVRSGTCSLLVVFVFRDGPEGVTFQKTDD